MPLTLRTASTVVTASPLAVAGPRDSHSSGPATRLLPSRHPRGRAPPVRARPVAAPVVESRIVQRRQIADLERGARCGVAALARRSGAVGGGQQGDTLVADRARIPALRQGREIERDRPGVPGATVEAVSSTRVHRSGGAAAQHRGYRHAAEAGIAVLVAIAAAPRGADVEADALERGGAGLGARGFAGVGEAGVAPEGALGGAGVGLRAGALRFVVRFAAEGAGALIVVPAGGEKCDEENSRC
jgi:hypothetical protein